MGVQVPPGTPFFEGFMNKTIRVSISPALAALMSAKGNMESHKQQIETLRASLQEMYGPDVKVILTVG